MKRFTALAIPALLLIAGCASEPESTTEQAATAEPAMAAKAGSEVVLAGTLGCGHCTFKTTESCAVGVQTADGATYILDGVAEGDELFQERQSGKDVRIVGTMAEKKDDGQHVMVVSYEM